MRILKQEKNPLLSRTSLVLEEDHASKKTPSNKDSAKKIAELLKTKEEFVKVKHIYSKFGQGKSKIIANVYTSLDKLKEIEEIKKKKQKVKKEKPKEQPKKEEVKKEKKEEPKKEEVKEDGKETKTQEQKAE